LKAFRFVLIHSSPLNSAVMQFSPWRKYSPELSSQPCEYQRQLTRPSVTWWVLAHLKDLQLSAAGSSISGQMTLQELQKQALQLSTDDRWHLVQALSESLKQETCPKLNRGKLSRLRGIAKASVATEEGNVA
jgi:hypothetical protein